jgi:hypothetical protein
MKYIISILLLLVCLASAKAQSITETKDWADMITSLQNENWQNANKLSIVCLKMVRKGAEEDFEASLLRYIFIYSEAGLMNLNKVSQAEALKAVKDFAGHQIVLPAHPVTLKNAFNSIEMKNDSTTDTLSICATNSAATDIFSFEYITMKEKWPIQDFKNAAGKNYRLSGLLKLISVEGHMFPRFRIIIDDGEYKSFDQ